MFDFIKKLFGKGKIRANIICSDGTKGWVKCSYIGDPDSINDPETMDKCIHNIKNEIWVKYGKEVVQVSVVGMTRE